MGFIATILSALGCSKQESPSSPPKTHQPQSVVTVEKEIHVGKKVVIEGPSPSAQYSVVFEDDEETAYFYGLDNSKKDNPILDALHIYNVQNVSNRNIPSKVKIVWSADGLKSALLINDYTHAIFDFQAKRGYCRTGFPPPTNKWSAQGHGWDEKAQQLFK